MSDTGQRKPGRPPKEFTVQLQVAFTPLPADKRPAWDEAIRTLAEMAAVRSAECDKGGAECEAMSIQDM